ncbi:hypothetical protein KM539_19275 [Xanthomonas translucens pv. poae]|uniref:hypothetical protein n=1 Tax=Xanthomonas graminis TaxID=3390026 RepID=UPI001112E389|nr:hypothetical protein [Xanthomonas translucens]UKE61804.1 hypothetical protein KM539_19275 [Xanthomonas translucens pv. poae]
MSHTVTDLRAIAASGGGMVLSARGFTTTDLRAIAASANSGGGQITLRDLTAFTVTDLLAIASSGGGRVVFDFLS